MDSIWLVVPLLIIAAIALVFFYIFRANAKKLQGSLNMQSDFEEAFKTAQPAVATIVSVNTGHALKDSKGSLKVDLRFEVSPSCAQPYYASSSWLVEPVSIPLLQQGSIVQVRIDEKDNSKVYPDVPWAKYWVY